MSRAALVAMSLLVLAGAAGALFWWRQRTAPARVVVPAVSMAAPPAPAAPPPAPAAPAIRYPLPPAPSVPKGALQSFDDADAYLKNALVDLLGHRAVKSFLRLDNIVRRIVATVDNLGTDDAAAQMWPVDPTPGRFEAESRDGGFALSAKNAERYTPFVRLVEGVDTPRVVALYTRLYPLFQRGYEDLGYGGKYFNDRLVEVIDNLLATPTTEEPIKVRRVAVDGASSATMLYVFEDPALERASAGQKILLRMGHENAVQVIAKLADVRRRIVTGAAALTPKPENSGTDALPASSYR